MISDSISLLSNCLESPLTHSPLSGSIFYLLAGRLLVLLLLPPLDGRAPTLGGGGGADRKQTAGWVLLMDLHVSEGLKVTFKHTRRINATLVSQITAAKRPHVRAHAHMHTHTH